MKRLIVLMVIGLGVTLALAQDNVITISQFIKASEGFSTLTTALEVTGLDATLQGAGPFTFFAPTDEAFAALPQGRREALLKNPSTMRALLKHLIVGGKLTTGELASGSRARPTEGKELTFTSGTNGMVTVDNAATIISSNVGVDTGIQVSNGVIQVIDTVVMP